MVAVLRLDSTLEEMVALMRLAIRLDAERSGLDVANMVAWSYGRHSISGSDLRNNEDAEFLAKSRMLDAILTFALVQLRAMQKQGVITLSKPDKQIVRQVRNYLAHPEAGICWEKTIATEEPADTIRHQGIVAGDEIRDVHFGYVVGILQLLLKLQSQARNSPAST